MDCSFTVNIAGTTVCFSDRELEVSMLGEWVRESIQYPIAVYGPEGCGKTTLFRYFTKRMEKRGYTCLYINALGAKDLSEVMEFHRLEVVNEIIKDIVSELTLPLGALLSKFITYIIAKLCKALSMGRGLIVVLDDVYKAIGLDEVDRYTKMLYEWINWKLPELNVREFLIVLTTSEGVSKRELLRHTYVHTYMLWNLPKDGFFEILEQLSPPIDHEVLWRISGGNPRLIAELANLRWALDKLVEMYRDRVYKLLTMYRIPLDIARRLARDPDADPEYALRLEEIGLMIQLMRRAVLGTEVKEDPELGIGKVWAWQVPLYKDIVLGIEV